MNVEIFSGRERFFGAGMMKAGENQPFSFFVRGVHQGTVTAKSEECDFAEEKTYTGSEPVLFSVPSVKAKACLFSITVQPMFTEDISNGVKWRALTGLLAVRLDDREFQGRTLRLLPGRRVFFSFMDMKGSRFYLRGCGLKEDQVLESESFHQDYMPKLQDFCVIEGFVKGKVQDITISYLVLREDPELLKIPEPKVIFYRRSVHIEADENVSLISFRGEEVFSNRGSFDYDGSLDVVSFFTTGGRAMFCVLRERQVECFR